MMEVIAHHPAALVKIGRPHLSMPTGIGTLIVGRMSTGLGMVASGGAAGDKRLRSVFFLREKVSVEQAV